MIPFPEGAPIPGEFLEEAVAWCDRHASGPCSVLLQGADGHVWPCIIHPPPAPIPVAAKAKRKIIFED